MSCEKVAGAGSGEPKPEAEKVGDWCDARAAGDICAWPRSQNVKNAVRCAPMPPPVTAEVLGDPVIIPNGPVFIDWPQEPTPPTPKKACGPDPYSQIPDSTVRTVVEMVKESKGDIIKKTLNHPLCPDASLTLTINPPQKKEVEIRVPECVCPVRGPQRRWRQCVESQWISDRVRRPMARCCHNREMPPLVIPRTELARLQWEMGRVERERTEREERIQDRECERLKSNYRHSLWNYTVDSLIDRKRKMQKDKLQKELDDNKQLIAEIHAEKDRVSKEEVARAKQQMLYRKGLIRDFHAAMANSKMLKDIEDEKERISKGRAEAGEDSCTKKMMWVNNRPCYEPNSSSKMKGRINRKQLELLKKDEARVIERRKEMAAEICEVKQLRQECPAPLPEVYKKYIAEPKCDPNDKAERQAKIRNSVFAEIHDKLATDAFIEAQENEIERQACEFTNYKRKVQRMQKEKEEQLIAEKVAYNQRKSEAAAAVLVKMQAKKQQRASEYDALKEQWQAAWEEKVGAKSKTREKMMNIVYNDFWARRSKELCRQQLLDPSRQWARERLVAVENYEQECDRKSDRRKAAEEIALYHLAQVQDKVNREMAERRNDAVWGCKAKKEYEDEMCEMKTYANECIQDWAMRGRPIRPMVHAMKKWDYDAGMSPRLFPNPICREDHCKKQNKSANCGKKANRPDYETTAKRLGFACGGGT